MPQRNNDPFNARETIDTPLGEREIYSLSALEKIGDISGLPYSIRVLLEACLRNMDGRVVTEDDVQAILDYDASRSSDAEIPFTPGRVVLQDFTGVPAVVDLAALRSAMNRMGGDAKKVNPLVPCDLVIDHSVQVDAFNSGMAITINSQKEFERNRERYELLKWAQGAFDNFRVVPPATGIVHQVNLEYLAKVVWDDGATLYPDSLIGTDSHTTMINGLGVLGWGVGGIEAEAVMLGQPVYMLLPEVVGFKLTGTLAEGCTATDLVLVVTQMLRAHGVVGRFVEFFGDGLDEMPLANRATIANMAPEYGATIGFFPVDEQTVKYLRLTGRDEALVKTIEKYCKRQCLWRNDAEPIRYSSVLELDMSTVEPALAGPKRPQDRIKLSEMKSTWANDLTQTFGRSAPALDRESTNGWNGEGGAQARRTGSAPNDDGASESQTLVAESDPQRAGVEVEHDGRRFTLTHGAVVIAAITSCTNTSNPSVMIGAGLLARNAAKRGLTRKPWVKTSLAPGSKVVTEYLTKAGLFDALQQLGFYLVGYGCTTCIGNSGPLPEPISRAINEHNLVACSVLSGNRNFEGRISPDCRANYLASPPLVVAYALAGTVNIDLTREPLGQDQNGHEVYLKDIWPTEAEIQKIINNCVSREQFIEQYANVFEGSDEWKAIDVAEGALYEWNPASTYAQEPPFFIDMPPDPPPIQPIRGARVLIKVGDSVTTDHISPAGSIQKDSPAGQYLTAHGIPVSLFNSYGSRRGNDRIMTRGTFANIRVRNQLAPGTEGGFTRYLGPSNGLASGDVTNIFEAAIGYGSCQTSDSEIDRRPDATPLLVIAGRDYGMGSSRDWAAKGTFLLGIRAVIAESFERIHRSNLVGMGVLPLTFTPGANADSLGLDGSEVYDIDIPADLTPRQTIRVTARREDGETVAFDTICRIDTPVEVEYYRNGGILHTVLRKMAKEG